MQIPKESNSIYTADKKLTFLLLCIATFLLLYIKTTYIESETAAFEFLADRPEGFMLQTIMKLKFFAVPFIYLFKFTVIGFVVWVGCFMYGYRITFSQCWGITMVAETIFLLAEVAKIIYFLFLRTDPELYEINAFYPLSLMNFFDFKDIDTRYAYPLRALNLFEIGYCTLLAYGIQFYTRKELKVSWIIVLSSYVLLFLAWLAFYVIVYH